MTAINPMGNPAQVMPADQSVKAKASKFPHFARHDVCYSVSEKHLELVRRELDFLSSFATVICNSIRNDFGATPEAGCLYEMAERLFDLQMKVSEQLEEAKEAAAGSADHE